MNSCVQSISQHYNSFSYSEKLLADYVTGNIEGVLHLSIRGLAEVCGVSATTVFNFTKKLGYQGYSDFKIGLASEMTNRAQQPILSAELQSDRELYAEIVRTNALYLNETISSFNSSEFDAAVDALSKAERIVFLGMGTSNILALEAYELFVRTGCSCIHVSDYLLQMIHANLLTKNDVAVVVAQSGLNKDVYEILELLKKQNVTIIGINNVAKTPFSKVVHISLSSFAANPQIKNGVRINHKLSFLCLIEALYYAVTMRLGDKAKSAIKKTDKLIQERSLNYYKNTK
ncbi:MurR/RpiR family transcriptional regulator [Oscillospiraceae bacterium PP1C4]